MHVPSLAQPAEPPARRSGPPSTHCLDCGTLLTGPYCAGCGQKAEPEHRSLWQLVRDAVGPAVLLESKLWRTLGALLLRPGQLSADYVAGRRTRYLKPLRLYLWVSLLFFSALALRPEREGLSIEIGPNDHVSLPGAPSLQRRLQEKLDAARVPGEAKTRLVQGFRDRMPKAVFVLLPVFALFLRALWWKRDYVEHLVFAVHAHTVLFLGLALTLIPWMPVRVVAALAPFAWGLPALRRFEGSSWPVTLLKAGVLAALYVVALTVVLVGTILLAVLAS